MKLRTDYKDAFVEKHGVKLGFMSGFVKVCYVLPDYCLLTSNHMFMVPLHPFVSLFTAVIVVNLWCF